MEVVTINSSLLELGVHNGISYYFYKIYTIFYCHVSFVVQNVTVIGEVKI